MCQMRCKVTEFIEKNINNKTKNCIILGYLKKNEYFCTPNESENCLLFCPGAGLRGVLWAVPPLFKQWNNNNKIILEQ